MALLKENPACGSDERRPDMNHFMARLDIMLTDRFGHPVSPREWFLVPLFVIDEAIERIEDGTITTVRYDPASAALVPA